MKLRPTTSSIITSSSHVGDGNHGRQEVPEHPDGDNHNMEEGKESLSGANEEKEEDEVVTVLFERHAPATESFATDHH